MNNLSWLVRASRWVRRPPEGGRLMLVVGVVVAAVLIASAEQFGWWPEWATLQQGRGPNAPRMLRP